MSRGKKGRTAQRNNVGRKSNMILAGGGAATTQDRGALQAAANWSTNPWHQTEQYRWREYTKWYETAWEAAKVVRIPPEDALREPFSITGMPDDQARELKAAYDSMNLDAQVMRALVQERLYGGAILLPILKLPEGEDLGAPVDLTQIREGDLQAVNVIDISQISRTEIDNNLFSATYDKAERYSLASVPVHRSRLAILDGSPLLGAATRSKIVMGTAGWTGAGFGESKLTPLYDLLLRTVGTQQGAYHLVNMASVLLMSAENLMVMEASGVSEATAALKEVVEQVSIYRGAVLNGQGVTISQHAASFGSVPELMMTFAQFLSIASDINAVRFLGQAPGGLNATGTSDLETHYNFIDAYQRQRVKPIHLQLLSFVGSSLWGAKEWEMRSAKADIAYPPLWNPKDREIADQNNIYATFLGSLFTAGVISAEAAVNEMMARGVFKTKVEAEKSLDDPYAPESPIDPNAEGVLSQIEEIKQRGL